MAHEKPFQLKVIPMGESDYGLLLEQFSPTAEDAGQYRAVPVVKIWGSPFQSVLDVILETLKKNGYRTSDLRRTRQMPLSLDEISGVKLGLLFLALKPLRKPTRMEAVSRELKSMTPEEMYYWFAKLTRTECARRAGRALRILLSEE